MSKTCHLAGLFVYAGFAILQPAISFPGPLQQQVQRRALANKVDSTGLIDACLAKQTVLKTITSNLLSLQHLGQNQNWPDGIATQSV